MINVLDIKDAIKSRNSLEGGWYGTVVNNNDPEQLSRIQVELDDLTKGIKKDDLPWYVIFNSSNSSANSSVSVPRVNSRVVVEFPNGNIYDGVVTNTIVIKPAKGN